MVPMVVPVLVLDGRQTQRLTDSVTNRRSSSFRRPHVAACLARARRSRHGDRVPEAKDRTLRGPFLVGDDGHPDQGRLDTLEEC